MRSLRAVMGLAVAAALAVGCGSVAPPGAPHSSATPSPRPASVAPTPGSTSAAPAPTASYSPQPAWPTTPRTGASTGAGYLTAVTVGRHPSFDRVVFSFTDAIPGYAVSYVRNVVSDAKGDIVALPGQAFLRIVFRPASSYQTYSGADTITPLFPTLLQVRAAGDFEGYLSFGIGLSKRAGFRVLTLTQPYRVAIDLAHGTLQKFPGSWDITSWPQFWRMQVAFNDGHQPWRDSPLLVVQSWAGANMPDSRVGQIGPGAFRLTEQGTGRQVVISGTRPVDVGLARLWVITQVREEVS